MLAATIIALGLSIAGSYFANGRLFLYRHDQKWRREKGAVLGDWPMSTGWDDIYRKADYAPEGHRLIPIAIVLQLLSVLLFAFTVWQLTHTA